MPWSILSKARIRGHRNLNQLRYHYLLPQQPMGNHRGIAVDRGSAFP